VGHTYFSSRPVPPWWKIVLFAPLWVPFAAFLLVCVLFSLIYRPDDKPR
jgi:hypothetical protein